VQHSNKNSKYPFRAIIVLLGIVFISIAVWILDFIPFTTPKGRSASLGVEPPFKSTEISKSLPDALGIASCSASACHGENGSSSLIDSTKSSRWSSSASHWLASDPHTKAYQALTGTRAKAIIQRLRGFDSREWPRSAEAEPRCLACHTNPSLATSDAKNDPVLIGRRAEGVGCESCHGNAGQWLDKHLTWTSANRDSEYEKYGMTRLNDLGERALVCSGCHLGAPEKNGIPLRDMNHDMIAAGHPRLYFELAEFQRRLRPHWVERDRHRDPGTIAGPEFEARLWFVGRIANAEASCQLLAGRVGRANQGDDVPWPEYSEFNCFSCHHQLVPTGWKQAPTNQLGTKGGSRRWQSIWPFTRIENLPSLSINATLKSPLAQAWKDLESVKKLVEKPKGSYSITVEQQAKIAAKSLKQLRSIIGTLSDREVTLLVIELYRQNSLPTLNWDECCQMVQGLAALERVRIRSLGGEKLENPAFETTFQTLMISKTQTGMNLYSPKGFDPEGFKIELEKLLQTVPKDCKGALK
jgi:hypothetical protein